jgi:hypothetical protein
MPTPWRQAFTRRLACRIRFTLAILATDLLVIVKWTLLITRGSHILWLALTSCSLFLDIERAFTMTAAASCTVLLNARALLGTLGPSPSCCAAALLWKVWTFTETEELWFLAFECRVLLKFYEACLTTSTLVCVVANVQFECIMSQKVSFLIQ